MNSPPDPASPASDTSSSDSPPPEETQSQTPIDTINPTQLKDSTTVPNAGKRRLPGSGSFGSSASARDPKSRRRDDAHGGRRDDAHGGRRGPHGHGPWDMNRESSLSGAISGGGSTRAQKEDLLDTQLVEQLRASFGDPFDDSIVKKAA